MLPNEIAEGLYSKLFQHIIEECTIHISIVLNWGDINSLAVLTTQTHNIQYANMPMIYLHIVTYRLNQLYCYRAKYKFNYRKQRFDDV